jgi:hypothetical protein
LLCMEAESEVLSIDLRELSVIMIDLGTVR